MNKGLWYRKKKNNSFYLPGEEINIRREDMFANWDTKTGGYTGKSRILIGICAVLFAYLLVALRLFDACVLPNLRENNREDRVFAQRQTIHRADITDRNGAVIATSLPTRDLDANAKNILRPRETAQKLVELFPELRFDAVYNKLKRRRGTYTIKRNLSPHQQSAIIALGNPGLEFRANEKRIYPHQNLMSHLVGSTDIDNNGVSGLEKGLDNRIIHSQIPVRLSVDLGVQDTIRQILMQNMQKFSAINATSILLDVNSGEIIAMVSLPDYDPNNITLKDKNALFNTATARVYEPGSVLKIFNTAMSLESGKVRLSEKFDATEPLKLKYNTIYDYRGENRWLSVEEVLVYSSNIGSARMALQSGFSEQYNFLKKIKFFERLDLELVETAKPLVPPEHKWRQSDSTVATIAYGYGISVSPLHLISAYAAMINGGIYHNPTVLRRTNTDKNGFRVISDNTSQQMRRLLRAVVTEGSGKRADVSGYEIGGKTGTANKLGKDGKYLHKKVRTTFMAAFPMSNPQYALLIMLDEPKATKDTFGFVTSGWNAVPTGAEIISAVAPQLGIPANHDLEDERRNKIIEASFGR